MFLHDGPPPGTLSVGGFGLKGNLNSLLLVSVEGNGVCRKEGIMVIPRFRVQVNGISAFLP